MTGFSDGIKGGQETLSLDAKALGRSLSSLTSATNPSEQDGDGDGFVTGPDGRDDIPAPIAAIPKKTQELWNKAKAKQLGADEARVAKAVQRASAKRDKPAQTAGQLMQVLKATDERNGDLVKREVKRWAGQIFNMDNLGDDGQYRARVEDIMIMGDVNKVKHYSIIDEPAKDFGIKVEGQILDKDGKRVGLFSRVFYPEGAKDNPKPHVYHDVFMMDKEYRGKGIGADFTIGSESMYRSIGLDSINLNAGLDDGMYTWARAGYDFVDDSERQRFAKELEKRYKQMLADAGSKEKLIAGGFESAVGRRYTDDDPVRKVPTPLFSSPEELSGFLRLLAASKAHPQGSDRYVHPSLFTAFPASRFLLRGMNSDMTKQVRGGTASKSLITKIDKIVIALYTGEA